MSKYLNSIYHIPSTYTVISDSLRSYHKLMEELEVAWIKIPFR